MNEYQLLSSIYKLLSESSEGLLKTIENTGDQPDEILNVIRSLRRALVLMDVKYKGRRKNERKDIGHSNLETAFVVDEKGWSASARNLWNSLRMALSNNKKLGITNRRLVEAFINSGIKTKARPKEGREKMLIEIQAALNKLDDQRRIKILQTVLGALGLDQTKGYMDAIKSKRPY